MKSILKPGMSPPGSSSPVSKPPPGFTTGSSKDRQQGRDDDDDVDDDSKVERSVKMKAGLEKEQQKRKQQQKPSRRVSGIFGSITRSGKGMSLLRSGRAMLLRKTPPRFDRSRIAIDITDGGPGYAPNDFSRVLYETFQFDPNDLQGGGRDSGLGMLMAKGVVRAHGGQLWMKSEGLGKGTTYSIYLRVVGHSRREDEEEGEEEEGEEEGFDEGADDPRFDKEGDTNDEVDTPVTALTVNRRPFQPSPLAAVPDETAECEDHQRHSARNNREKLEIMVHRHTQDNNEGGGEGGGAVSPSVNHFHLAKPSPEQNNKKEMEGNDYNISVTKAATATPTRLASQQGRGQGQGQSTNLTVADKSASVFPSGISHGGAVRSGVAGSPAVQTTQPNYTAGTVVATNTTVAPDHTLAAPHRPLHVLVVDDSPLIRRMICRVMVSSFHATTEEAEDGQQAIDMIRKKLLFLQGSASSNDTSAPRINNAFALELEHHVGRQSSISGFRQQSIRNMMLGLGGSSSSNLNPNPESDSSSSPLKSEPHRHHGLGSSLLYRRQSGIDDHHGQEFSLSSPPAHLSNNHHNSSAMARPRSSAVRQFQSSHRDMSSVYDTVAEEIGFCGYDLILCDNVMPNMDGPAAVNYIRQEMGLTRVPIFGVTGNVLQSDVDLFVSHGANVVLPKPLQITDLRCAIEKYCKPVSAPRRRRALPTGAAAAAAAAAAQRKPSFLASASSHEGGEAPPVGKMVRTASRSCRSDGGAGAHSVFRASPIMNTAAAATAMHLPRTIPEGSRESETCSLSRDTHSRRITSYGDDAVGNNRSRNEEAAVAMTRASVISSVEEASGDEGPSAPSNNNGLELYASQPDDRIRKIECASNDGRDKDALLVEVSSRHDNQDGRITVPVGNQTTTTAAATTATPSTVEEVSSTAADPTNKASALHHPHNPNPLPLPSPSSFGSIFNGFKSSKIHCQCDDASSPSSPDHHHEEPNNNEDGSIC